MAASTLKSFDKAWEDFELFVEEDLSQKHFLYNLNRRIDPMVGDKAKFFAAKLESLLPRMDFILNKSLATFTYYYLTIYSGANLLVDEASPKVGKALWSRWVKEFQEYGSIESKSNPVNESHSDVCVKLQVLLQDTLDIMGRRKTILQKHLAVFFIISICIDLNRKKLGGYFFSINTDASNTLASSISALISKEWAQLMMLPLDVFSGAFHRFHRGMNKSFLGSPDSNFCILELILTSLGSHPSNISAPTSSLALNPSSRAIGITKSYLDAASSSMVHISPQTNHSVTAEVPPSLYPSLSDSASSSSNSSSKPPQHTSLVTIDDPSADLWCWESAPEKWTQFSPATQKALSAAVVGNLDQVQFTESGHIYKIVNLSSKKPVRYIQGDDLTATRVRPPKALDSGDVLSDNEESDDEDQSVEEKSFETEDLILTIPTLSVQLRLRALFENIMPNFDILPEPLLKPMSLCLSRLADSGSVDDLVSWVKWMRELSTIHSVNSTSQLKPETLKALLPELVNSLLRKSPHQMAFCQLYDCLENLQGLNWKSIFTDMMYNLKLTHYPEVHARLPSALLPNLKTSITPSNPSTAIIQLFLDDPLPKQLELLSRHGNLRQNLPEHSVRTLFNVLATWQDLFVATPWPEDIFGTNRYEYLVEHHFNFLRNCGPALRGLKELHGLLHQRQGSISPIEVTLASILVKRFIQRLNLTAAHSSFLSNFNGCVAELADPSHFDHVPPGVVALLTCHYIADALFIHLDWSTYEGRERFSSTRLFRLGIKLVHFLEWYRECLASQTLIIHEALRLHLFQPSMLKFTSLIESFKAFFNRILLHQVSRFELDSLRKSISEYHPAFEALARFLGMDFEQIRLEVDTATARINTVIEYVEMITAFKAWFDQVRVSFTVPPIAHEDINNKFVCDLVSVTDTFKRQLSDAGLTEDLQKQLKSGLLPHRSEIFHWVFEKVKNDRGVIPPKELPELIIKACNHLQVLFSETSPLSSLRELWIRAERLGSTRLEQELAQLGEIVQYSKSKIRIDDIKSLLENGATLSNYAKAVPGLVRFCDDLPSLARDIPSLASLSRSEETEQLAVKIRRCHSTLLSREHLQVKDINSTLELVQATLNHLEPHTLNFFSIIPVYDQLVRFCQRSDFHNKVGILTGQIQGMQFANDLLSSLVDVHGMLSPLYTSEPDLGLLLQAVKTRLGNLNRDQLELKWRKFETCRANFSEIMTYFSGNVGDSAVAFLPTAIRALKFGRYLVRTSPNSNSVDIALEQINAETCETESILERHNLHGRLRTMTVFVDRSHLKPEEIDALDNFRACYDLALEIANCYNQLSSSGHPVYQSDEFTIGDGQADMTVANYTIRLRLLKAASSTWHEQIQAACMKTRRLILLTPKSISSLLLNVFAMMARAGRPETKDLFHTLGPHLALAFPELCSASGILNISLKALSDAFFGKSYGEIATIDFASEDNDREALEDAYGKLLAHCASMLSALEENEEIATDIDLASYSTPGAPTVIRAGGMMTPIELWKVVIKAVTAIPHPSQLLYGSRHVTLYDLERFLSCTEHFPNLAFVVFGVNELSHDVRHRLLHWTSSSGPQSGTYGQLILLFTADRSGEDMFGFLQSEVADRRAFEIPQKSHDVLLARQIASFYCLHSEQGKSTKALAHLKSQKPDHLLELSISEGFEITSVLDLLKDAVFESLVRARTIGIHIDIKPYADLSMVSRFLNDWFYFGIIRDPSTGDALYSVPYQVGPIDAKLDQAVKTHTGNAKTNPIGLRWHIVVELSNPASEDEGFLHLVPPTNIQCSVPPILEHLPSVYHLRSLEPPGRPYFTLTVGMRLLAGLLRSFHDSAATGKFNCVDTAGNDLDAAQALQIFNREWAHIKCLRQQFAIIKRLSGQVHNLCRWYALMQSPYSTMHYHELKNYNQMLEANQWLRRINGARAVFGLLLEEAVYLTSTSKNATPVPIVVTFPVEAPSYLNHETDEYQIEMAPRMANTVWYVVSFSPRDPELEKNCPLPVKYIHSSAAAEIANIHHSQNPQIDAALNAIQSRRELRQHMRVIVADALGIKNTGKMIRMLEQRKYVLTPNLAHKLLQLNARVSSGNNVILVGDTGQGKTEMVNFFSVFLNMDHDAIPDLLEELATLLCQFTQHMYARPIPGFSSRLEERQKTRGELLNLFKDVAKSNRPVILPPPLLTPAAVPSTSSPLELSMASIQARAQAAGGTVPVSAATAPLPPPIYCPDPKRFPDLTQDSDANEPSCWPDLRATLREWLDRMFERYSLLEPSEELDAMERGFFAVGNGQEHDFEQDGELLDEDGEDKDMQIGDLERYLTAIMDLRLRKLFFKQLMYRGLSLEVLSSKVQKAIAAAEENPELKVLFFIDESNTTAYMGRLKELIVDHRWNNRRLPPNISIVAAINPQKLDRGGGEAVTVDFARNSSITNVVSNTSKFDVRLQHPSMEELVYHFTDMDQQADDEFWEAMIELGDIHIDPTEQRTVIEYVLIGQQQIRDAKIENMHPSIRDLVRAMRLFKYFRRSIFGSILIGEAKMETSNSKELNLKKEAASPQPFSAHFWKALFMTLAVGYYFRLRNEVTLVGKPHPSTRASLLQAINAKYESDHQHRHKTVTFSKTLDLALLFLFENTAIPAAIAPTSALIDRKSVV